MTRLVRGLAVSVAALVVLLDVPRAAEASLIGDSVTCSTVQIPFQLFHCFSPTATVTAGPAPEFIVGFPLTNELTFSVDVAAASITVEALGNLGSLGEEWTMIFGDLDSSAGDIVGVGLVTSGGVVGLDASDVSFTAHSVTINPNHTDLWDLGDTAVISLIFENAAPVAAPTTLLLVAAGLVGVGAWRRRR